MLRRIERRRRHVTRFDDMARGARRASGETLIGKESRSQRSRRRPGRRVGETKSPANKETSVQVMTANSWLVGPPRTTAKKNFTAPSSTVTPMELYPRATIRTASRLRQRQPSPAGVTVANATHALLTSSHLWTSPTMQGPSLVARDLRCSSVKTSVNAGCTSLSFSSR